MAKYTKRGVPLIRNAETMTESQFFSWLRSALRRLSIRWKPRTEFLKEIRRSYTGTNKKIKWEYPCKICKKWFIMKNVEVDHIVPCGSLKSFDDIGGFCDRLFIEKDGYQLLCKECHNMKTHK